MTTAALPTDAWSFLHVLSRQPARLVRPAVLLHVGDDAGLVTFDEEDARLQVEKLTQDHSARMERVFVELNERNQQAVTQALSEVSTASSRMSQSVDTRTAAAQLNDS